MKTGMDELNEELAKLRARGIKGLSLSLGDSIGTDPDVLAREAAKMCRVINDPDTQWKSYKDLPKDM